MTKNRIRLLTVALVALILVLAVYFCVIAMPTAQAKADTEYILSDVKYYTSTSSRDEVFAGTQGYTPYISYFTGYAGSPTVGSYFAYGNTSAYQGYAISSSTSNLYFDPSTFPTVAHSFTESGAALQCVLMTISVDFLNGFGSAWNETINRVVYKALGYLNFKTADGTKTLEVKFLYNSANDLYYLLCSYYGNTYYFSVIPGLDTYEGGFFSLTIAYYNTGYNNIAQITTALPFARNYYSTVNFNNRSSSSPNRENQAFLDAYSLQCYAQNLYEFDNLFYNYDEVFDVSISDIINSTYDKAFSAGYAYGYNNGNLGESLSSTNWLSSIFSSVSTLFNIKIFGSITIATVIFIPLMLGIVLLVLKFVRG